MASARIISRSIVAPFSGFSSIEKQPDIDVAIGPVVSSDAIAEQVDGRNARSRLDPVCENFGQCAQYGVQREISLDRRSDPNQTKPVNTGRYGSHSACKGSTKLPTQQHETAQADICAPRYFRSGALNHSATLPFNKTNSLTFGVRSNWHRGDTRTAASPSIFTGLILGTDLTAQSRKTRDGPQPQRLIHHLSALPISAVFRLRYVDTLMQKWAVLGV